VENRVDPHVAGEVQPVRNVRDRLKYSAGICVLWCEFANLGTAGERKVCSGKVHLVPRLEDKWAAASVGILFLPILCECEQSMGVVKSGGNILQEIICSWCVRGRRFEEAAGCNWVLARVQVER
jgi:hypothetical protein